MSISVDGICEVWQDRKRVARKEHRCDACKEVIKPGDQYLHHFHVWEGEPETVKRCLRCEAIYQHLYSLMDSFDEAPALKLNCGHTYEEEWQGPPPPEIAALAFMTQAESQEYLRDQK